MSVLHFGNPPRRSIRWCIRVHKRDSAFIYNVLEANGELIQYSTLPHQAADLHRDLELFVSPDFEDDGRKVLDSLKGLIHVITSEKGSSESV